MLNIVQRVAVQGTKPFYEDACGVAGDYAWVIDGATSLVGDDGNDGGVVAEFARHLSESLCELSPDAGESDLRLLLFEATAAATRRVGPIAVDNPWDPPSAAVTLAHITSQRVRLVQAADVSWRVTDDAGRVHQRASEPVFARVSARTSGEVSSADPWGTDPGARRAVYRETRSTMNTPGGYPVVQYGMSRPVALDEVVVDAEFPEVVLFSDGWPILRRKGFDRRLHASDGFDDATYLRVRAATTVAPASD